MSAPAPKPPAAPPRPSGVRMVLVMGSVGLLAAVLLVATFRLTAPRIAANRAAYLEASIAQVLPDAARFEAFVLSDDGFRPAPAGIEGGRVFAGVTADGSSAGLAVEAAGQGYADVIRILYGFDTDCRCVVGMKVLESKETPGLGDKIETDPAFRANFEALQMAPDGPTVVMVPSGQKTRDFEIEAITGATISSRAITDIIARSTATLTAALDRFGAPTPAAAPPTIPAPAPADSVENRP